MGVKGSLAFVAIALLAFLTKTLVVDFRAFEPIKPYSTFTDCKKLDLTGPEDVQIDHKTGIAYISSADHTIKDSATPRPESHVYSLDLASNKLTEMKLINHPRKTLTRSHGLSLYRDDDRLLMYLIHHTPEHDSVELFEIKGNELHYLDSIHDTLLFNLNDVVAVSSHEFYVTIDHFNPPPPKSHTGQLMESLLRKKVAFVTFCDIKTKQCKKAIEYLEYPNGIAVSRDSKLLYVASSVDNSLHVYTRNASNELVLKETVALDAGLDNIDIDDHNRMWVTNHPKPLHFLVYMMGFAKHAPGRVWRQKSADKLEFEIVFETHGDDISGPSTTAAWRDHVLIGSVKSHFLHCKSSN
jgi:sugar lactone lactonase YvrE